MSSALAVLAGSVAAIVCYWLGAVVVLLMVRGLPLGSAGGAPGRGELIAHLALGVLASLIGAKLALRGGRFSARLVGALLATGAIIGFSKPGSNWPSWFPLAQAIACLVGVLGAMLPGSGSDADGQRR